MTQTKTRTTKSQKASRTARIEVRPTPQTDQKERRRFVRLEVTAPMGVRSIKDIFGNYFAGGGPEMEATMLNLCSGGVLVEIAEPLNEGDVVGMRFSLTDLDPVDGVLGIVKRCEFDEDCHLVGIQFVNRDELVDCLTASEMELLDDRFGDFEERVGIILQQHQFQEQH